jgi:ATP-binding cassette subfamily F protein uup
MSLLVLQGVTYKYFDSPILDDASLTIGKGEKIALLGRNGAGKTTMLKLLMGQLEPDSGAVHRAVGTKVSMFSQYVPEHLSGTVFEVVASGLGEMAPVLSSYYRLEQRVKAGDTQAFEELAELRAVMDKGDHWPFLDEIYRALSSVELSGELEYSTLSGGQKRRAMLASALAVKPDVLLLDEPTNHLDVDTIAWLEDFLARLNIGIVFVTHDRMLLKRLANAIVELDRGRLYHWVCDYDTFLTRKNELLEAEAKEWERFDKKLALEEVWIRKGIQARRTRNEGRVRALKKMREERRQRRERLGTAKMRLVEASKTGVDVIEAKNISFSFEANKPIIKDFSLKVNRGDKLGIIGPNGCGKTTLIKLLLGQLSPNSGEVVYGTNLEVVYFDQLRNKLDESKTIWENVCPHGDTLIINEKPIHIITYLENFLFSSQKAKSMVSTLSGGEKNRVLLAQVFSKAANVLVLDEPTNDLDIETLELLEELITNFSGTVLLICHDRVFLNNVVSSTLVFAENGEVREIVGGYDEWIEERKLRSIEENKQKAAQAQENREPQQKARTRLSYNEKRELEALPEKIEGLEAEIAALQERLADPLFYKTGENPKELQEEIERLEEAMMASFEREEELQGRA